MKYSIWFNNNINLLKNIYNFCINNNINTWNIEFFCWYPLYKSSLNRFYDENITKKDFEKSIFLLQDKWFKINYLLNSKIINYDLIEDELKWLKKIWVEILTISNLELIDYINKNYSNFKIVVSIIYWTKNSIDILKLSKYKNIVRIIFHQSLNHEFRKLLSIISQTKSLWFETELLANELCFSDCKLRDKHYLQISKYNWVSCDSFDEIWNFCSDDRKNISIIFDSPWIRPEDIMLYDKIWIDFIKLAWRNCESDLLLNCIKWYLKWKYDWNFFNLMDLDWKKWWWRIEVRKLSNRKLDWFLFAKFKKWKD